FNLYTYLFAAVVLLLCFALFRAKEKKTSELPHQPPKKVLLPIVGYVIVMAVCLFLNSYFKTAAAKHLDATQIYPLSQGGSLILSMLMSAILFREKINLKAIVGVALSFVALLLINVL
ncbi:MAG: EamA family transporter, partial [Clostridia bacterium]|nr:EamA family transporter [Clostridia bacterium]